MTEGEVFQEYLDRGFDDVMPFADYLAARSPHLEMDHQLDMEALHRRARNNRSKYRPMNETGECQAAARRRRQMGHR